jgi:hypothetical protein
VNCNKSKFTHQKKLKTENDAPKKFDMRPEMGTKGRFKVKIVGYK